MQVNPSCSSSARSQNSNAVYVVVGIIYIVYVVVGIIYRHVFIYTYVEKISKCILDIGCQIEQANVRKN